MPLRLADVPSSAGRCDTPTEGEGRAKDLPPRPSPPGAMQLSVRDLWDAGSPMPNRPSPLIVAVWVRRECAVWDRGPYHWTRECIEGRALVEIDRARADAMSNLRPCRLCAARDRRRFSRPQASAPPGGGTGITSAATPLRVGPDRTAQRYADTSALEDPARRPVQGSEAV